MKKILITAMIVLPLLSFGQNGISIGDFEYGYRATGIFDTVKVKMLVTTCEYCYARQITGFAVREILRYYGDRMPPSTYEDMYTTRYYLDADKKPLPKTVTIFMTNNNQ